MELMSAMNVRAQAHAGSADAAGLAAHVLEAHRVDRDRAGGAAGAGSYITVRPRHVMTHDNTTAVIGKFRGLFGDGRPPRVADPRQPVFAIDHDIQDHSPENLGRHLAIETFARRHGIDFYPAGTGIAHQLMLERGYVLPGDLVVGSDSHSNMYGAVGALGAPVVRTDAACLWATGETWFRVPPTTRVELSGDLAQGVSAKDVILTLCARFAHDVLGHAVEFGGSGLSNLSMPRRLTIANMTTEWGASACIFEVDEITRASLVAWRDAAVRSGHADAAERLSPDRIDAAMARARGLTAGGGGFEQLIEVDLSAIRPHVTGPNDVHVARPLGVLAAHRIAIQRAYLLSCVNARVDDLAEAAAVFRRAGRPVAEGVRFYLAAASSAVEAESRARGDWDVLVEAGATVLPSGCGPCIGLGEGTVEAGETAISATNRNFPGRMGSREASVYLASPAVVAASAIHGFIRGPQEAEVPAPSSGRGLSISRRPRDSEAPGAGSFDDCRAARRPARSLIAGFPERIEGPTLLALQDDISTDGIYAGRWTYRTDMTPEQMAGVIFENHDPALTLAAAPGQVLLAGSNFGCGSSREQAATALLHRGIRAVIAGSVNDTFSRNAFNNGLIVLECAALIEAVRTRMAVAEGRLGPWIAIDFAGSTIALGDRVFDFVPLSEPVRWLIASGGVEAQVRARLADGHDGGSGEGGRS